MEDFYQYIYSGSFGGYDPEKLELINDYFLNAGKKNRFFDSDTYEYVVAFLIEQGNFGQAREVLSVAENLFPDRKSTRLNSSHTMISYAVFCLKKKNQKQQKPE